MDRFLEALERFHVALHHPLNDSHVDAAKLALTQAFREAVKETADQYFRAMNCAAGCGVKGRGTKSLDYDFDPVFRGKRSA